ncbi:hypothetical protein [Spongiactinospora rosea]|uniref:hypothetical protein n=1 Tax=Spongiactinospora rosea TaxID=2248750 RepID=UPI0011C02FB0|nr:hypothetical protein [Spongiactinospora rosea]
MEHRGAPTYRPEDETFLEGKQYLDARKALESATEILSLETLPKIGEKLPKALAALGDALSIAERASSCWWGCSQGSHSIEYMLGGIVSTALASTRILLTGFYDESLTLTRSIAERGNLFHLLRGRPEEIARWEAASENGRWQEFSPVKVRLRLEELGDTPPTQQDRYKALSGRGIHPGAKPQAFNPQQRAASAGIFQPVGMAVALNELARAVALALGIGVFLLTHLPLDMRKELQRRVLPLAETVGGATIVDVDEFLTRHHSQQAYAAGAPHSQQTSDTQSPHGPPTD